MMRYFGVTPYACDCCELCPTPHKHGPTGKLLVHGARGCPLIHPLPVGLTMEAREALAQTQFGKRARIQICTTQPGSLYCACGYYEIVWEPR